MLVRLKHDDIVNMIVGIEILNDSLSRIHSEKIAPYGQWLIDIPIESDIKVWIWDDKELNKLTCDELLELYNILRAPVPTDKDYEPLESIKEDNEDPKSMLHDILNEQYIESGFYNYEETAFIQEFKYNRKYMIRSLNAMINEYINIHHSLSSMNKRAFLHFISSIALTIEDYMTDDRDANKISTKDIARIIEIGFSNMDDRETCYYSIAAVENYRNINSTNTLMEFVGLYSTLELDKQIKSGGPYIINEPSMIKYAKKVLDGLRKELTK